ncbi:glycosyltransferase [Nocardioides sp. MAHUQ-72]|uniref:glycosyltransferase n=1 Tax=unclassified Nocardioides TaxID=2615069 RepID=UPI00360B8D43
MPDHPLSVIIPAHDEEAVIGRLLEALGPPLPADEVIVVCDGCTDRTAEVARRFPGVRVIEAERGGKPAALNIGDEAASLFPRFYVDADIVVSLQTLREVQLDDAGGALAGAPSMHVDLSRSSWPVGRFYDIWTRLPYTGQGMIGSGVIGLARRGRERFEDFPPLIGDDEFLRRLFTVEERCAPSQGFFTVTAPRRLGPLVRIKTRGRLGIMQLDAAFGPAPPEVGEQGRSVLLPLLRDPRRWPGLAVFATVRVLVGIRARRRLAAGDVTWDRDETARDLTRCTPDAESCSPGSRPDRDVLRRRSR